MSEKRKGLHAVCWGMESEKEEKGMDTILVDKECDRSTTEKQGHETNTHCKIITGILKWNPTWLHVFDYIYLLIVNYLLQNNKYLLTSI